MSEVRILVQVRIFLLRSDNENNLYALILFRHLDSNNRSIYSFILHLYGIERGIKVQERMSHKIYFYISHERKAIKRR